MEISKFVSNILNENVDYIDLFGYKIYIEDLLLISLIFCLYKEGVEDQLLFMCLILLLFS